MQEQKSNSGAVAERGLHILQRFFVPFLDRPSEAPMERRQFAAIGLSAAAVATLSPLAGAQERTGAGNRSGGANRAQDDSQSASFRDCAKACTDCQRECDSCAMHCGRMLSQGHGQDHYTTLRTCLDCADICGAAAKIMSRSGPFAGDICEACADACKRCAEACKHHAGDKIMQDCAAECERCEKACRDMVRTARQGTGQPQR
jgi:hypothetical protein